MVREMFNPNNIADYGKRGFKGGLNTLGDFKQFLLRGNVVDLAVGVVIGAAFNGVVQGMVKDLITPLIGVFVKVEDLQAVSKQWEGQNFLWGDFISLLISFVITAAVVYFLVVKPINILENSYNRLRPKTNEVPTTRECPFCLSIVNIKATRCAFCTTQLPSDEVEQVVLSNQI